MYTYDGDMQMVVEPPHDLDLTVLRFHLYLYQTGRYSDDYATHFARECHEWREYQTNEVTS